MTDEGYTQQPPLTSLDVAEFIAAVERTKKQIFCAPDVYEQVRDAVYGAGLGIAYRVVKHPFLEDGQVLLGPSEAEVMDVPLPTFPFGGHGKAPAGEAGA